MSVRLPRPSPSPHPIPDPRPGQPVPDPRPRPEPGGPRPPRRGRLFAAGLGVRLAGVGLIWVGDGSPALYRKVLVAAGVVLSVGGIAVLRFLLLSEPLSRLSARWRRPA